MVATSYQIGDMVLQPHVFRSQLMEAREQRRNCVRSKQILLIKVETINTARVIYCQNAVPVPSETVTLAPIVARAIVPDFVVCFPMRLVDRYHRASMSAMELGLGIVRFSAVEDTNHNATDATTKVDYEPAAVCLEMVAQRND